MIGRLLIGPALLCVPLMVLGSSSTLGQTVTPAEEFLGPFASWSQVQCTGGDDTALLQNALNAVGTGSNSPVLYIKPGTCRITAMLTLGQREKITILGADAATTRIQWAGPAGGSMIWVNGVGHARYGRLTWDGGGTASKVYDLNQDATPGGFFATGNRHEDEVFQNLAASGWAVTAGHGGGTGDAETEWLRVHFIGPMEAGIFLGNYNVLDHWVWDSEFRNVKYGVTNHTDSVLGAGGFAVNRSNFLNNNVDIGMGNANFASSRWNYSRGSGQHVYQPALGSAPSPWTSQGETIVDPTGSPVIGLGDIGPLGIFDLTMRGGPAQGGLGALEGYGDGGELWSLGNTFSNTSPYQYFTGTAGRFHGYTDDKLGVTITDPGPLPLPPTPAPSSAPVIEVQNGDIAGALAQAGSARAIVHIPFGHYGVTQTLEVGPNVLLTGDGWGATVLSSAGANPILHLTGPSHAVLRDFSLYGQNGATTATGVAIDNADQTGGLVHSEDWISDRIKAGWDVSNLSQTTVDLFDHQGSSNSGTGTPSVDLRVTNGRLHLFNGAGSASDTMYELHGGELVSQTMYYESSIPTTVVAPNSSGTLVLDVGKLQASPGTLDTTSFSGSATILNMDQQDGGTNAFGPSSLVMGFLFGSGSTYATPPTMTGSPYALYEPRHNSGTGGSDLVPEQTAGITDQAQYIRSHLATLRAAKPLSMDRRTAEVTDVRMYRLGGELMQVGARVTGAAGTPVASPMPTSTPTNTPTAAATATLSATPTPTPTIGSSSATAFVTGVISHVPIRNDFTGLVGAQITVGPNQLTVTDLGRYVEAGNSAAHTLAIYRATDQALVASTSINLATALKDSTGYAYAPLTPSVTLAAGGIYYVVSQEAAGSDSWEGNTTFPTLAHTAVASMQGAVYKDTAWTAGPGSTVNQSYVPISFRYQTGAASSPPVTTPTVTPTSGPRSANPFVTNVSTHVATRNNWSGLAGMQITVGASAVTVSDLGRYVETGNSRTHTLAIYRASDGVQVASTSVNLATAAKDPVGYAYAPLPAPVTLTAGGVYYIVSSETNGGDTWEGNTTYPTLIHTNVASIQGGIYRGGTTWQVGPGSGANQGYVPTSFR